MKTLIDPPQKTNTKPINYMPCLYVNETGYIEISKRLADALNLSDETEKVRFPLDDEDEEIVYISKGESDSFWAWRGSWGRYTIQIERGKPYKDLAGLLKKLFGDTITAKTSQPHLFDNVTAFRLGKLKV